VPRTTTALITGSTSGIGRATALALARAEMPVVIHGRDADRGSPCGSRNPATVRASGTPESG
jgi:NAD(P)-dependent dehydrogenase (short-subunit alcohol dehydrogenase family)